MPKDVEDYVHQIGRTGRSGKTGIATTFVNMGVAEPTLLDLKYLLMEAKQRIPPFLQSIEDPNAGRAGVGCQNCGGKYVYISMQDVSRLITCCHTGLGHTILTCPKLEESQRRTVAGHRGADERGGGY